MVLHVAVCRDATMEPRKELRTLYLLADVDTTDFFELAQVDH